MTRRALAIVAAAFLTTSLAAQQPGPDARTSRGAGAGNESITQADLRADLFFLAGDAMRGRLTDTNENRATADYIRARFERAGLKPVASGNSYFHNYNLMTATLGEGNALAIGPMRDGVGASREYKSGQEFYPQRFSAHGTRHGPGRVRRLRHHRAEMESTTTTRGDLTGKIVLVLDHEPGERDPKSPFEGVVTAEPAVAWRKALAARRKARPASCSSAMSTIIPMPANFEQARAKFLAGAPARIPNYTLATWADRIRIPAAQISPALADDLDSPARGKTLAELGKQAETAAGGSRRRSTGSDRDLRTAVDRHIVPDRNVLGLIEGSDPKLKDEWVLVTAHFDHDGVNGTQILNGADDNGSGTVALLEIADAYAVAAQQGQRPKRSVLFCAWNSEERGLLGAWAYTEFPPAPLANIAGVLNMDMIGRNEEVQVGGGNRFNGLEVQTAESNANAVNMMGFARAPELADGRRRRQRRHRPRHQEALRQQLVEPGAPQRSVAVPAARRARARLHDRPASGLPHAVRPAREDQLREDGKDRAADPPGELEPGQDAGARVRRCLLLLRSRNRRNDPVHAVRASPACRSARPGDRASRSAAESACCRARRATAKRRRDRRFHFRRRSLARVSGALASSFSFAPKSILLALRQRRRHLETDRDVTELVEHAA